MQRAVLTVQLYELRLISLSRAALQPMLTLAVAVPFAMFSLRDALSIRCVLTIEASLRVRTLPDI